MYAFVVCMHNFYFYEHTMYFISLQSGTQKNIRCIALEAYMQLV